MKNNLKSKITIATRKSPLALWQANWVKNKLEEIYPELEVDLLKLVTKGDEILDKPLAKIGGKGLFLKELEMALLDGRADLAVHSMKDVPMELPSGFALGAITQRGAIEDVFVSNQYKNIEDLPAGAVIGTSSARRKAVLQNYYSSLNIKDIRGNLQTRLNKLDQENYDGLILAAAGLERLELENRISERLNIDTWLPAPGQGALGIECLEKNSAMLKLILKLNHQESEDCVKAERAVSRVLGGSCAVPLAAFAKINQENKIVLKTWVVSPDGKIILHENGQAGRDQAEALGIELANKLKARGFESWRNQY